MNIWWLFDDCMIIWWSSNRRSWAVSQANTVFLMGGSGCWPWNGGPFSHLSYIHPFWWQIFHSLTIDHTDHFLKIWRGPILILESRKTLVFKTSHQHCYQIYHYCMLPYVDWHKWVTHIHTYTYITLHYIRLHYITLHTIIQSYNHTIYTYKYLTIVIHHYNPWLFAHHPALSRCQVGARWSMLQRRRDLRWTLELIEKTNSGIQKVMSWLPSGKLT